MNRRTKLLKIIWKDKVPDTDILSRAYQPYIYTMLRTEKLKWVAKFVQQIVLQCSCVKQEYARLTKTALQGYAQNLTAWGKLTNRSAAYKENKMAGAQK